VQISVAALAALVLGAAALFLLVGLFAGWSFGRRGTAAAAQVLADKARADAGTELATLAERVRGLEGERQALALELQEQRVQATSLRDALDLVRDEKAQLGERAGRVAVLETQLTTGATRAERLAQDLTGLERRAAALEASLKA
jgi:chromosome segregation ATPase